MSKRFVPKGFSRVSPHLLVPSIEAQIDFLRNAFDAELVDQFKSPDGKLLHATARIGDTTIMIGLASDAFPAITSMNYIFFDDPDAVYRRALALGASSVEEPADQFFGHRQSAVRDPQGNVWWIARFIREVSEEELSNFFRGTA